MVLRTTIAGLRISLHRSLSPVQLLPIWVETGLKFEKIDCINLELISSLGQDYKDKLLMSNCRKYILNCQLTNLWANLSFRSLTCLSNRN